MTMDQTSLSSMIFILSQPYQTRLFRLFRKFLV
jgi:hypothetical protein